MDLRDQTRQMKILLDIDGVMVPAKPWIHPARSSDGFYVFKPTAVDSLNVLISNHNADLLLTTSHRHSYSLEKWRDLQVDRGVIVNSLNRLPIHHGSASRREEIMRWIHNNPSTEFIIIDDDSSLQDLPSEIKQRWIQTKPYIGLTRTAAEMVSYKSLP